PPTDSDHDGTFTAGERGAGERSTRAGEGGGNPPHPERSTRPCLHGGEREPVGHVIDVSLSLNTDDFVLFVTQFLDIERQHRDTEYSSSEPHGASDAWRYHSAGEVPISFMMSSATDLTSA